LDLSKCNEKELSLLLGALYAQNSVEPVKLGVDTKAKIQVELPERVKQAWEIARERVTNENELVYPLLRRMGFLLVRYTHGKKEYGKDFTFSENTPFGTHRHYGLQAKAGNISGGVNAATQASRRCQGDGDSSRERESRRFGFRTRSEAREGVQYQCQ
jgi:hypothetical protein